MKRATRPLKKPTARSRSRRPASGVRPGRSRDGATGVAARFSEYHSTFSGDTRDACDRCGGKCEQFRIFTLMPGEKQYMASGLGVGLGDLEKGYLDCLDTPYGCVDVLKMKEVCSFLDGASCSAGQDCRPVLCDSYPIVFRTTETSVVFHLDSRRCPMVRLSRYASDARRFVREGIPALKRLKIPIVWWHSVQLYDEFDLDRARIQEELRATRGYEVFMLEEVLAFATNGGEMKARRRGLDLLAARIRRALDEAVKELTMSGTRTDAQSRYLLKSYGAKLSSCINDLIGTVEAARGDRAILGESSGVKYRRLVRDSREIIASIP
jgi:Fe-S-cluster containining protein